MAGPECPQCAKKKDRSAKAAEVMPLYKLRDRAKGGVERLEGMYICEGCEKVIRVKETTETLEPIA